jgi:phosphoglycerate-specific signal transduction histidine kinase
MQCSVEKATQYDREIAGEDEAPLRANSARVLSMTEEINEPLTAISNYCESARLLLGSMPDNEQVQKVASALEAAIGQVFRAGEKVRRLTDFIGQEQVAGESDGAA